MLYFRFLHVGDKIFVILLSMVEACKMKVEGPRH